MRERTSLAQVLDEVEREMLLEALKQHEGNRAMAARVLDLDLAEFEQRLRTYGLDSDLAAD